MLARLKGAGTQRARFCVNVWRRKGAVLTSDTDFRRFVLKFRQHFGGVAPSSEATCRRRPGKTRLWSRPSAADSFSTVRVIIRSGCKDAVQFCREARHRRAGQRSARPVDGVLGKLFALRPAVSPFRCFNCSHGRKLVLRGAAAQALFGKALARMQLGFWQSRSDRLTVAVDFSPRSQGQCWSASRSDA